MYNGWTESESAVNDRMNRKRLAYVEYLYGSDWEQMADALRTHVEALDMNDWVCNAEHDHAEWIDHYRTQEEARY